MLNSDYKEMLQRLLDEKAEFMLVGAYALSAHGYPRATGDIDIWVKSEEVNAKKVYNALEKFGAPAEQFNEQDFIKKGIIFQLGVAPRRIDIITDIAGVAYEEADTDKIIIDIEGLKIPVISLDKLIKNKKATGRKKDLLDAKTLQKRKKL